MATESRSGKAGLAANWVRVEQILSDDPQLEPKDFLAVYAYAAELTAGQNRYHETTLEERVVTDPSIMNGKLCFRDTRVPFRI